MTSAMSMFFRSVIEELVRWFECEGACVRGPRGGLLMLLSAGLMEVGTEGHQEVLRTCNRVAVGRC
jgi:hypothetical protein